MGSIQQVVVDGTQGQVGRRTRQVGKADGTVDDKRVAAGGIEGELVEGQPVVGNAHGPPVEVIACPHLADIDGGRVHLYAALQVGLRRRAPQGEVPVQVAGQLRHPVRHEGIGHGQGQTLQRGIQREGVRIGLRAQQAVHRGHLPVIAIQIGTEVMAPLGSRQPRDARPDIAHRTPLVGQRVDVGLGGQLQGFGSLYIVGFH